MEDATNRVYGSLKALFLHHKDSKHNQYWVFECTCGKRIIRRLNTIKYEAKKHKDTKPQFPSCGCQELAQKTKHGFRTLSNTHPTYRSYRGIVTRCYDKKCPEYKWYGAVGVTICDEWKDNPKAFCEWSIKNGWKPGYHIDKDILCEKLNIHPHIYSQKTCIWVPAKVNVAFATNRRNYGKHPNIRLSYQEVDNIIDDYVNKKMSAPEIIASGKYPIISASSIYRLLRLAGISRRHNRK